MGFTLTPPEPLAKLGALDRSRLHVFVAGPGFGEGIAIALPSSGWLLVDCSRTEGGLSLLELLRRFRVDAEEVSLVLTHPHDDHADGFAELVELSKPSRIGVAATSDPRKSLYDALRALLEPPSAAASDKLLGAKSTLAVRAIAEWERRNPGGLVPLHDGKALPTAPSPATVVARSPAPALMAKFVGSAKFAKRVRYRANELGVVLEVGFGQTRLVLGADVPERRSGGAIVAMGWRGILSNHPHLAAHHFLKVPHHGSREAQPDALLARAPADARSWCVTPYIRSGLPDVADMRGLPGLLDREPLVHLTAVPSSKRATAVPSDGTVPLAVLQAGTPPVPPQDPFLGGAVDVTASRTGSPLDPVWAFAFDGSGVLLGRWRGPSAVAVVV